MYESNEDPPYDNIGKVIPVIGSNPRIMPMFHVFWKIRQPNVPMINVLSRILSLFKPILKIMTSNAAIASKVMNAPT